MRTLKKKTIFSLLLLILPFGVYYFYPEAPLPENVTIDSIIVDKSDHRMDVFSAGTMMKSYKVSLGRGEWGIHDEDWDNVTPVGSYIIDTKFTNSSFHKALTISFGNQIEIHGIRNYLGLIGKFHRWVDWTRGCIAVTNQEVDELYRAVPVGAKIVIND
jgi:murein L,D-transpeptidase YafK